MDALEYADFWSYDGSLTTPPCTEGIKWSVLKEIQPISAGQVNDFAKYWASSQSYAGGKGNNRETQPWNYRAVLDSSAYAKKHLPMYTGADLLTASVSILAAATMLSGLV